MSIIGKSDKSIHSICIASIKRKTKTPYDFVWTKFYEKNDEFIETFSEFENLLSVNELLICSTIIDIDNFSLLTTQKLVTKENGILLLGNINHAKDKLYGDFKGAISKEPYTFGMVKLEDSNDLKYFIETGRASMVMIYGVRTRIRLRVNV